MNKINLGCGYNYVNSNEWVNLDFVSTGENVIAHNLLKGIPFKNESFDLVYHSHLLEHFSKADGQKLIAECFRVLRPGGILRIVVPDLEGIVRDYIKCLEVALTTPDNELAISNYNWMLLELYDQAVRNNSGGNMKEYLFQDIILNEKFVYERIGQEAKSIRNTLFTTRNNLSLKTNPEISHLDQRNFINTFKKRFKTYVLKKLGVDEKVLEVGKFRFGGEVHQWMYDRFSLFSLLHNYGGTSIELKNAFSSFCNNWSFYNLDSIDGEIRKPDSLFMEAIK